jgi:hypothetical protein
MLYDDYKDEAEFRKKFVFPFLSRMGFVGVQETHGSDEFGCDFICSELHRVFGHRHYAVVVKAQEKIGQGKDAQAVLVQIRQAFAKPIRTSVSPRAVRASVVMVINSGTITDHARQELWNDLVSERYGDNVIFLDGHQLQSLSQFVSADDIQKRRGLLIGLRAELLTNANNLGAMIQTVMTPGRFEPLPILTATLEIVASRPELHEELNLHDCMSLLNALSIMRNRSLRLTAPAGIMVFSTKDSQGFQNSAVSVRSETNAMCARAERALLALEG